MKEEAGGGNLSLGLLVGETEGGGEVRGLGVEETQQELLEDWRPRVEDLLLLLLSVVPRPGPGHQVGLPLLQELGRHEGPVVARPLVGDGPLAEDHHHGLVLHTDPGPGVGGQLAPDLLVQDVHAVVIGAAVEGEPVQHGQDLAHGGVLAGHVGVRPDVTPVLVSGYQRTQVGLHLQIVS